jgi:hypothetical protein
VDGYVHGLHYAAPPTGISRTDQSGRMIRGTDRASQNTTDTTIKIWLEIFGESAIDTGTNSVLISFSQILSFGRWLSFVCD